MAGATTGPGPAMAQIWTGRPVNIWGRFALLQP
jgi:hypothetical protein